MKVITLWQPWATLMAIGAKTIETRSWPTNYRGLLAIHAGARDETAAVLDEDEDGENEFAQKLAREGFCVNRPVPTRAIVAVVNLFDCQSTNLIAAVGLPRAAQGKPNASTIISDLEYECGDFHDGRFGWRTRDLRRLAEPIPARGAQGLWTAPETLQAEILRAMNS